MSEHLLLVNKLSPGDVLVMSAAIESLHATYPKKYLTSVQTTCDAIYESNPRITFTDNLQDARQIEMHYNLINKSDEYPVHFVQGYIDHLSEQLQIKLPLVRKPFLYLSNEERQWINQVAEHKGYKGRFWLINAGVKQDYIVKGWGYSNYQQVVDALQGRVVFVQVGSRHHLHRPLRNVINLIGETNDRQLIRLAYHAQGAVTGVSFLHHIMAAFSKPCVTIASGMEPKSWEQYETGVYLSAHGMLPCCRYRACWKKKLQKPDNDPEFKESDLCLLPINNEDETIPKCMAMVSPLTVVKAIEDYHFGLSL